MSLNVTRLPNRRVIHLTGEETLPFLQDLLTCDTVTLDPGEAAHGGLLMPQGKILFDFFIIATADGCLIDCDAEQCDALVQRLTMYKLRRAITITTQDNLSAGAAWGGGAPDIADATVVYVDPRLAGLGHRIIAPVTVLDACATSTPEDYAAMRIAQGVADSAEIGSAQLFPHEANYDQFGSVNFKKGCYVGQEVVSRMQHRGTARSRIVPVKAATRLPAPGADIMTAERQSGSLIASSGNQGLAVLRLDRAAAAGDGGLSVAGITLTMHKPLWAHWPDPATGSGGED